MHRRFIALIIAAAVAVTGLSAAPARADEDAARLIAGLAALALLGAAIRSHNKDNDGYVARRTSPPVTGPMPHRPELWRKYRRHDGRWVLPGHCLRELRTGHGQVARFLGKHCLDTNYRHARSLPPMCRERLWTQTRVRNGYDVQCLRQKGYQIARH